MQISTYQNKSSLAQRAWQQSLPQGSSGDDDDAWSGYGDTLELDTHDYGPDATTPLVDNDAFASPTPTPAASPKVANEFAAAEARLNERGRILEERQRQLARRPNIVNLQHLNGSFGAPSYMGGGYGAAGYGGTNYNQHPAYRPPAPATPPVVDAFRPIEASYVGAGTTSAGYSAPIDPSTGLPFPLDAWGNPILPDGAQLDQYGNVYYT